MKKLVLASHSPRRRELLKLLGHPFEVTVADVDEVCLEGESPADHVRRLAAAKARAAAEVDGANIIIGADTVVVIDGDILGKPRTRAEAGAMLRRLGGRTHEVFTGFALCDAASGHLMADHERTEVTVRNLADDLIRRYLATGESDDKAGAYGIQGYGAALIDSVRGCYFTVMGLPLARLMAALNTFTDGTFGYFGTSETTDHASSS